MSPSSRESELNQLREALAQSNSEFFLSVTERRRICVRIQTLKEKLGAPHYNPDREKEVFQQFESDFKALTLKELLAFSLVMEDQAGAMAPGTYPSWSTRTHLSESGQELFEMINPLLLKVCRPDIFKRLPLSSQYAFLKDF